MIKSKTRSRPASRLKHNARLENPGKPLKDDPPPDRSHQAKYSGHSRAPAAQERSHRPSGRNARPVAASKTMLPPKEVSSRQKQNERTPQPMFTSRNAASKDGPFWLYGTHAAEQAILNPHRRILRLLHSVPIESLSPQIKMQIRTRNLETERMNAVKLSQLLPKDAVHQGLALFVNPLPPVGIEGILLHLPSEKPHLVVILDQVTDPHNVGAILRSAAAFGAAAVIVPDRNTASENGAMAKAASGALDVVPFIRVANLARAIEQLKAQDFWLFGLAGDAASPLSDMLKTKRAAIVLGAEGTGMRRLTRDLCDVMVRLPTEGPIHQLNVSNAAAIAFYEWTRQHLK